MNFRRSKRLAVMFSEPTSQHSNLEAESNSATISGRFSPGRQIPQHTSHVPDAVEGAIFLDNPTDSQAFRIGEAALRRLCSRHRIPFEDVLVPSVNDRAHTPRRGTQHAISSCVGLDACRSLIFLERRY